MTKGKRVDPDASIKFISARLKELRKDAGFSSYEDFALQHDLDRKQYWRVENGANITLKTLIRILALHGKSLPEFFSEIKDGFGK